MKMFSSADKSDIRAVVKDMATQLQKIKILQEDIKASAKGLEEKYKNDGESPKASIFVKMARLELAKDQIVEKQEEAQTPYDFYSLIMEDGE